MRHRAARPALPVRRISVMSPRRPGLLLKLIITPGRDVPSSQSPLW